MINGDPELLNDLLSVSFERYEGTFSDGVTRANNKVNLDFSRLSRYPRLLERAVGEISDIAEEYEPDFVVAIPDGATGLGHLLSEELSARLGRPVLQVVLSKDPQTKKMSYATRWEASKVQYLKRGFLTDDVYRTGINFDRALEVEGLEEKIVAGAALLQRSGKSASNRFPFPVRSVVQIPISPWLPEDSDLWKFAK